ncbi:hypothetical protein L1285_16060 [Pseudoalteromonas sp. DL2-H2.2]|uniref:hypothetical protein n=1 Tax=Pseudoalteromonas sp. DL2-H2.2 TaxID=2908889 RepID=UPI001F19178A|nr:hypothetical protein [Pseudoalteromonas sp. DL2-H2.2]MCF2909840.1 hypothetical protein [Pseudoalteromonas sp. DL2-H2.2]
MSEFISAVEGGKQRGYSGSFIIDGEACYCSAAIQKFRGAYKAHVSIIKVSNLVSETYEVYFTRAMPTLESAIKCVEENGPIRVSSFGALKGQKIFNPSWTEENDT